MRKKWSLQGKVLFALSLYLLICGVLILCWLVTDYYTAKKIGNRGTEIVEEFERSKDNNDESVVPRDREDIDLLSMLQSAFQNQDVIGYIYFPEAEINYPIVQGKDNQEYMRRDVYGNESISGSIFLDYENENDFSDVASIVYGHHMRNGSMFGSLESALSNGYEGKQFSIYTRDKKLTYSIVSAKPVQPNLRGKYLVKDSAGLEDFISTLKEDTYISCGKEDKFVTLITCHYINKNTIRYAVTGSLISEESY